MLHLKHKLKTWTKFTHFTGKIRNTGTIKWDRFTELYCTDMSVLLWSM